MKNFTASQFRLIEATIDEQFEENMRVPIIWMHKLYYLHQVTSDRLYLDSADMPHTKNTLGGFEPLGRAVVRPDDPDLELILQICRRSSVIHVDVKYAELLDGSMKILRFGEIYPNMTGQYFEYIEGEYVLQSAFTQIEPDRTIQED